MPAPVPQIPVSDLGRAISFYQLQVGFALDWKYEDGLAGVSRGGHDCFWIESPEARCIPVRVWLNRGSVGEVDTLYSEWQRSGVPMASPPEQKPWGICEFIAEDCNGNSYRVFY